MVNDKNDWLKGCTMTWLSRGHSNSIHSANTFLKARIKDFIEKMENHEMYNNVKN